MEGFSGWLGDYVQTCNDDVITDEIRNLASRPFFTVTKY
jgi:hypothetical protein